MVSERNRVLELVKYIESFGVEVNLCKNKARGNKGFFKVVNNKFRIDIAKGQDDVELIRALVHEFTHFIHYNYDKTLTSLDFIFDDTSDKLMEDLLESTVKLIPKSSVEPLFTVKNELKTDIKILACSLKTSYPDFKADGSCKFYEKVIVKTPLKYLIKYDRVKINEGFSSRIYSIDLLDSYKELSSEYLDYIRLKSKQRALRRVNTKICRLNKYYNSPTELLARAIEYYVYDRNGLLATSPLLKNKIDSVILENRIPQLTNLINITL